MKVLLTCLSALLLISCNHQPNQLSMSEDSEYEKVDSLLNLMTIEEKVGQMCQVTTQFFVNETEGDPVSGFEINEDKLREAIVDYKLGSFLNVPDGKYPTLEEWRNIFELVSKYTEETRLKIPVLYGVDAIHGVNYTQNATLFPQPLAMASTWNPEIAREIAEITAYECRASGIPWTFSPAIDIGRMPEWPRLWESFGEDVLLNQVMGEATTIGFQGDDTSDKYRVAACLKHFTGYGFPLSGKDRTQSLIPEIVMREIFIPPYINSLEAGALTVMISSGEINGIPTHANKWLLTDVLKNELGFEGIVVTDWADINYLHNRYKIAHTEKEAVRIAIEAGIDMSMVPYDANFVDHLLELVNEGTISEDRINESVRRILWVKFKLGLFDQFVYPVSDYPDFGSDQFKEKSIEAASESIILAKNNNEALPISTSSKILVTGPGANSQRTLNGGWTYTWQGDDADWIGEDDLTILEALENEFGKSNIVYAEGADYEGNFYPSVVSQASKVDQIVICVGEPSYCEDYGNLNDLNLEDNQIELVKALAKTGKPITLVITEGRPKVIRKIADEANAILLGFFPGPQGSVAIAGIISGRINPSGKLPITYPGFSNSLTTYDHKYPEARDVGKSGLVFNPQFEFGHGLSYTNFEYSDLVVSTNQDTVEVSVSIENTGERTGKEVVQVYISDLVASITPPIKRLRDFKKISLEPKEQKTINFHIPINRLAFVNQNNKWVVEPGEFKVLVADLEKNFTINN